MKASVLFVDETSNLGGGEVVLVQMASGMRSEGWTVGVALPSGGRLTEILQDHAIEVLVVPRPRLISTSFYVRQWRKVANPFSLLINLAPAFLWTLRLWLTVARRRPALVHTVSLWSHACASLAAFLGGVPVIWHVQDLVQPARASALYARLFRLWARWWPARILCVSDAVAAQFGKAAWTEKKVRVLWNAVDLRRYAPRMQSTVPRSGVRLTIGTAARLTPWKGQEECLEAARALQERGIDFEWRFAGTETLGTSGYARYLARRAGEMGLANRVQWLGWVQDMPGFYHDLDILVHLPTEPDPCPLVLMEAAACGVPLISTGGGSADRIVPGAAGCLVPGRDPARVAQVLEEWARLPEGLQKRGQQARAFAEANFDLASHAKRLASEYTSVLGEL